MSFVVVFPVAPVIADDARRRAVAHGAGDRRERGVRVVGDERRGGAARERVRDEVGAAADRDEEVALLDPPRVDLHARDLGRPRPRVEPAERLDQVQLERDHRRAATCEHLAGDVPVVERDLPGRELLLGLGAAAGDHDDVARRRPRRARARSRRGGRARARARRARPPRPRRRSPGGSDRGLSEVRIARSASSETTRPISGRLPRSRSPPAPKTTVSRPSPSPRAARITFSSESGVCA